MAPYDKNLHNLFDRHTEFYPNLSRPQNQWLCLEILSSIPIEQRSITKADPPYEINGKGTPVNGSSVVCAPRFITICAPKNAPIPPAKSFPKGSLVFIAMKNIRHKVPIKKPIITTDPKKPNSSAMIAKIESVVFSGRYAN